MKMKNLTKYYYLIIFPFLMFINNAVFAIGSDTYGQIEEASRKTDDRSRQALESIFGEVVNNPFSPSSTSDTLVSSVFKVFNVCLLVVAAFFAGYLLIKKLTQTAHDGNVFDAQKNTLWMPIRSVIGVAFIIPTANGWSLSQLIMLWAASSMGIGIANMGADAALDAFGKGTSMVVQPTSPNTRFLARALYENNLCMHSINASIAAAQASNALLTNYDFIQQQPLKGDNGFTLKSDNYSCGGAELPHNELMEVMDKFNDTFITLPSTTLYREHLAALNAMQQTISASSKEFVNNYITNQNGGNAQLPDVQLVINRAASDYERSINAALGAKVGDLESLKIKINDSIKDAGWLTLGAWYQTMAMANTKLNNDVATKASVSSPTIEDGSTVDFYNNILIAYRGQKSNSTAVNTIGSLKEPDGSAASSDASSVFARVFDGFGQKLLGSMININAGSATANSNQYNPIIKMKNIGDYIMVGTETSLGIYVALNVAKSVSSGFSIVGIASSAVNFFSSAKDALVGAFDAVSPILLGLIISLFLFGMMLSIYIPMVPYIIWFGAIINWIIIVGEAIVAAPLWAMTHLGSEGEGVGQKTGYGYIFLLNVMLRPILMVIGFFLGGAIVIAGGTILNETFLSAVANSQFDSITGLFSIMGFLALYTSLSLNLIHTSFNLIYIVPDQVINWVGGHVSSQLGRDETNQAKQMILALSSQMKNGSEKLRGKRPKIK
jgi:conjugal transfer/type IV secretion protein DotA/TraY